MKFPPHLFTTPRVSPTFLFLLLSRIDPTYRPGNNPRRRKPELPREVKFLHVSSHPYHLPPAGKDPQVDRLVAAGELKLVGSTTGKDGVEIRFAVSKGVIYRKPKE